MGLDTSDGALIIHADDDDVMSDMRVAAQTLPILMGQADMTIPSVSWSIHINHLDRLVPSRSRHAHGLMAYTRASLDATGCRFADTSQGEDDIFIRCLYYSGMQVYGIDITPHIVIVMHQSNIWNRGAYNHTKMGPPPSQLLNVVRQNDFRQAISGAARDLRDDRGPHNGKTWVFRDHPGQMPWWWELTQDMHGPWPLRVRSQGCPRAHLDRMLEPESGTIYPERGIGSLGCAGGRGGESKRWEHNATHCIECSSCHYYNRGRKVCSVCDRCQKGCPATYVGMTRHVSLEYKNSQVQLHVRQCEEMAQYICGPNWKFLTLFWSPFCIQGWVFFLSSVSLGGIWSFRLVSLGTFGGRGGRRGGDHAGALP